MAGFLHLFDHNPVNMGRKHKNRIGGFEAPRNSLESPAESFQSYYTAGESCSNEVSRSMSQSSSYSTDASLKKFDNDAVSKGSNNKQQTPSIVARLMGMDVPSPDTESFAQPSEKKDATEVIDDVQKQQMEKVFDKKSKSYRDKDYKIFRKHAYFRLWSGRSKHGKPHARVHPQEKELQQFKKDFEAWQAARFLECARIVQLGNIPEQWVSQLDLTKEKMAFYENARQSALEKTETLKNDIKKAKTPSGSKKDLAVKHMNLNRSRKQNVDRELDELSMADFDQKSDVSSAPSRIVILKPGPESFSSNNESWVSSSSSVGDKDCIEDLLEEVKERLKCELHGKTFIGGSMVRGGGIETPFKEKPLSPKKKPHDIRTTTEDNRRRLLRSESSISYRSEINPIGLDSPEVISKHSRDISECSSRSMRFDDTRERLEQAKSILNDRNGWNSWNDGSYGPNAQARSFREENFHSGSSPRSLMRSLSAPASRSSFGKLLMEDRHMFTGAHITRKHESLENVGLDGKIRKNKFNIREKVSNLKSNLTLRGKLFHRKLRSVDLSHSNEFDLTKDVAGGPTAVMNFSDRNSQENYTELPPSPASICSSAHEEFWKPIDHPSPISDITSVGDHSVGNVFREISSNLTELRRQLNQLDYEGSEVTTVTDEPIEAEILYLEDESETYIKNLLIASGLYDGSSEKYFSRWDPLVKHIGDWVFDKVEESYRKTNADKDHIDELTSYHKLLFHLLNEALCIVLRPPINLSRYSRRIINPPVFPPLQGRKLLEKVWEIISDYIYSSYDQAFDSLDDMMCHDLDFLPWFNVFDVEEIKLVARELEARITVELIEEVVKEMQVNFGVNKKFV